MPITFKCSCGRELTVPDDSAGREAFCPACRKKVPVPAGGLGPASAAAPESREASEFHPGALASLLGAEEPPAELLKPSPGAEPPAAPPPPPPAPQAPAAAPAAPADKAPAAKAGPPGAKFASADTQAVPPPGVEVFADKIKFHCECGQKVSVKLPAPQSAGKCPRCGRALRVPDLPGAPPRKDRRPVKDSAHCPKCGRRIEDLTAVFCPRCGFPLDLRPPGAPPGGDRPKAAPGAPAGPAGPAPKTQDAPAAAPDIRVLPKDAPVPQPPPAAADAALDLRKRSARQAAEAAADLLRPADARGEPAPAGAPAGLGRRLAAFLLDCLVAGAVALVAMKIGERAGLERAWPTALVGLGIFLVSNEVLFAALAGGRSLGMVIAGVAVVGAGGAPATALLLAARLLAWLLLFIGAPLAIFDGQRRTLHDLVCGTTMRQPVKG